MKIVQVNTVCGTGSTGKICMALYHLSESSHMTPYIAYGRNTAPDEINSYKIGSKTDFYCHVLRNFIKGENGFASSRQTMNFIDWLQDLKPDIIHLHNIHGFYLNLELLFSYLRSCRIPVVWTFHDCWPFTGHCAYFDYIECDKWKNECNSCPQYRQAYPYSIFKDNSKASYLRKKSAFTGMPNLTIVTPSKWLADLVQRSFLKEYRTLIIPNGIDLDLFKPATDMLPASPKTILGVANVWTLRKGLQYFEEMADLLPKEYVIQLVGLNSRQVKYLERKYSGKILPIRHTQSIDELVQLYQRSYVFVNPTLEDNFPTTNLEALACGTPVITFNTGGSPECITDTCGLVVKQKSADGLVKAIHSLENSSLITPEECRKQALQYSDKENFQKYIKLYQNLVSK